MRSVLIVAFLAGNASADTVSVTIDHNERPFRSGNTQPISVTVGGAPRAVAVGKKAVLEVDAGGHGRVVPIEVRIPGVEPIKRLAALVPGARYTLRGNPCSFWELATTDASDREDTYRVDASKLPAAAFPLTINGETLDKPGVSKPFTLGKSAMCLRGGESIVVRSGARVLFDQQVIGHPGRDHTLALTEKDFTFTVDPARAESTKRP